MTSIRRLVLRGLPVPMLLALAALAPPSAVAFNNPTARATCLGPASLGCVPCPVSATRCPDPEGQVGPGVAVTFDSSPSTDVPPGTVAVAAWNFADGGQSSNSPPQPTLHAFGAPGTYVVTLEVRDDQNQSGTTTMSVVVGARLKTTASPGIVLGAGALSISATVDGRANPSPAATLDFRLYGPDDATCASAPVFQQLGVPYPVAGGPVSSSAFTPTLAGTYRWSVSYGGDPANLPAPLACGASVVVSAPPPPAQLPPGVAPGDVAAGVGTNPTCFGKRATIVATIDDELITGTPGPDVIVGGNSGEEIDGRGGNDTICSRGGDDVVRGSAGNDRIYGGRGADLLLGGTGADLLYGQSGKDRLGGGSGSDRVDGGAGNDLIDDQKLGGAGKDRLVGGTGADRIRAADASNDSVDCGSGHDSALLDREDRQRNCNGVRREV
jgi:Ca2+-binding RTX toxin-like protein